MWYVYVLRSRCNGELYVGCTNNLKERLKLHNKGKVLATKSRRPLALIHYEAFLDKYDAYLREKWLKTGWGRRHLRKTLANTLRNLGGPSSA